MMFDHEVMAYEDFERREGGFYRDYDDFIANPSYYDKTYRCKGIIATTMKAILIPVKSKGQWMEVWIPRSIIRGQGEGYIVVHRKTMKSILRNYR